MRTFITGTYIYIYTSTYVYIYIMYVYICAAVSVCVHVCMHVCVRPYGWMDGWMDGRMDGWMDCENNTFSCPPRLCQRPVGSRLTLLSCEKGASELQGYFAFAVEELSIAVCCEFWNAVLSHGSGAFKRLCRKVSASLARHFSAAILPTEKNGRGT